MRRIIFAAIAGAGLTLGVPAAAHAVLDRSVPAAGGLVPDSPAFIALWFSEAVEPAFSWIKVIDDAGREVDLGESRPVPGHSGELRVGLRPLPQGAYTVVWRVVSSDTHATEGTFTFRIVAK